MSWQRRAFGLFRSATMNFFGRSGSSPTWSRPIGTIWRGALNGLRNAPTGTQIATGLTMAVGGTAGALWAVDHELKQMRHRVGGQALPEGMVISTDPA